MKAKSIRFHLGPLALPSIELLAVTLSLPHGVNIKTDNPVRIIPTGLHHFTVVSHNNIFSHNDKSIFKVESIVLCCALTASGNIQITSIEGANLTTTIGEPLTLKQIEGAFRLKGNGFRFTLSTPYSADQSVQTNGQPLAPIFHLDIKGDTAEILIASQATIIPLVLETLKNENIITKEQGLTLKQAIVPCDYSDRLDLATFKIRIHNGQIEKLKNENTL